MTISIALIKRNLRLFLRDKASVFFSFLSTIIVVCLYFLFIARIYITRMDNPDAGGIAMPISQNAKSFIVYLQMMAGVLVLNSISLTTGAFSSIAKDFEDKRIDNLMLTPVKTHEMIFSYFVTGVVTSFFINAITWLLSFCIIGITTGFWLGVNAFFMTLGVLMAASLISGTIMLLITTLVKSSAAIGIINGISGTFFGFLCGIYMPYSNLGETTKNIGSILPFSHLTVWLKQVVLGDAFSQIGIAGEFKDVLYRDYFSAADLGFCSLAVPLWVMLIISGVFGLICLVLSYFFLFKRINKRHI